MTENKHDNSPPTLTNVWEYKGIVYFTGIEVKQYARGSLYVEVPNDMRQPNSKMKVGNKARVSDETAEEFGIAAGGKLSGIAAPLLGAMEVRANSDATHFTPADKS